MKSSLAERYRSSLQGISRDIRSYVNRPGGLDENSLLNLILNPQDYSVDSPEQPLDSDVNVAYDVKECTALGQKAIDNGEVAYCIMAGGAGTRIGEPKALLRVPEVDVTLLTIKLFQAIGTGPIWIVVSAKIRDKIIDHVRSQIGIDQTRIEFIEQYASYRLTPDNQVSFIDNEPELYPCGHGDLFPTLHSSKLLNVFTANGGKYVAVVNVDNVMGSLDPAIIGRHILSKAKVSCEVVERAGEDSGGVLCDVNGSLQIVEGFRIHGVDPKEFKWLNTNSFIMNADIDVASLGKSWNRVQKNVNDRLVIQHERLLQEVTMAYETNYLGVLREERFMPIKNTDDLVTAGQKLNANARFR